MVQYEVKQSSRCETHCTRAILRRGDYSHCFSPFNNCIWSVLKPGNNQQHLTLDNYKLNVILSPHKQYYSDRQLHPIQSATGKYFAGIDTVNIFCSVPISATSQPQFAFTFKRTQKDIFKQLPMGYLKALPWHRMFEGNI